jgi:hypothetical protein
MDFSCVHWPTDLGISDAVPASVKVLGSLAPNTHIAILFQSDQIGHSKGLNRSRPIHGGLGPTGLAKRFVRIPAIVNAVSTRW